MCIAFYPAGFPIWGIYLVTGLTALGFAGAQMMSWIIFPDVVDIGEMGLGERITGSFSGVMTFCRKASSALAIFVIGIVLSATGFITPTTALPHPIQPAGTMFGIRLFVFVPFILLMGFAWFVARNFRLTPQVSQRVKYFNEKLRNGQLDSLNEDEKKEYEQISKEFV
jgi:GPH family glycoside/pentoside/hexuronide:cation symporter/oligogalacturonide transporter